MRYTFAILLFIFFGAFSALQAAAFIEECDGTLTIKYVVEPHPGTELDDVQIPQEQTTFTYQGEADKISDARKTAARQMANCYIHTHRISPEVNVEHVPYCRAETGHPDMVDHYSDQTVYQKVREKFCTNRKLGTKGNVTVAAMSKFMSQHRENGFGSCDGPNPWTEEFTHIIEPMDLYSLCDGFVDPATGEFAAHSADSDGDGITDFFDGEYQYYNTIVIEADGSWYESEEVVESFTEMWGDPSNAPVIPQPETRAERNRNIARCYGNISYRSYWPDEIEADTVFCDEERLRDNRNDMGAWIFDDHPDKLVSIGEECGGTGNGMAIGILGILFPTGSVAVDMMGDVLEAYTAFSGGCRTYDKLIKSFTRSTPHRIELLFAFQGSNDGNIIDRTPSPETCQGITCLAVGLGMLEHQGQKNLRNSNIEDFKFEDDPMGLYDLRVPIYVEHLHAVWPFIHNRINVYKQIASNQGKTLGIKITGHSAGGALSEMMGLVLASRFFHDDDVDVESFAYHPVKTFRPYQVNHVYGLMKSSCKYNHHAFHDSRDQINANYVQDGGRRIKDGQVSLPPNHTPPPPQCDYKPMITNPGGGGQFPSHVRWIRAEPDLAKLTSDDIVLEWFPNLDIGTNQSAITTEPNGPTGSGSNEGTGPEQIACAAPTFLGRDGVTCIRDERDCVFLDEETELCQSREQRSEELGCNFPYVLSGDGKSCVNIHTIEIDCTFLDSSGFCQSRDARSEELGCTFPYILNSEGTACEIFRLQVPEAEEEGLGPQNCAVVHEPEAPNGNSRHSTDPGQTNVACEP